MPAIRYRRIFDSISYGGGISLGYRPVGISRALSRLPPKVLTAESYRNLVDLLDDPVPAKFLHHTGSITEPIITGLHRLPVALRRPAIMAMFNRIDGMTWFVVGCGFWRHAQVCDSKSSQSKSANWISPTKSPRKYDS